MRALTYVVLALLLAIQLPLWFGKGGWFKVWEMQEKVRLLEDENTQKQLRNDALQSEVDDLKTGKNAIEEEARYNLGLMKRGEVFIQVLPPKLTSGESSNPHIDNGSIQTYRLPPP